MAFLGLPKFGGGAPTAAPAPPTGTAVPMTTEKCAQGTVSWYLRKDCRWWYSKKMYLTLAILMVLLAGMLSKFPSAENVFVIMAYLFAVTSVVIFPLVDNTRSVPALLFVGCGVSMLTAFLFSYEYSRISAETNPNKTTQNAMYYSGYIFAIVGILSGIVGAIALFNKPRS